MQKVLRGKISGKVSKGNVNKIVCFFCTSGIDCVTSRSESLNELLKVLD